MTSTPLPERIPAGRSDGAGATNRWNKRTGRGEEGDLPGDTPTPGYPRLKEVHRYWVHAKSATQLHGSIADDEACPPGATTCQVGR